MTVVSMSKQEFSRLRVMIDLADGRLTAESAGTLMGIGRRQVYRLCRAFEANGPSGLASRKRGRPSSRRPFGHHSLFSARSLSCQSLSTFLEPHAVGCRNHRSGV